MKILNRNKDTDVESMSPEDLDKLVIEAESSLTILEKERDRKKARYDSLFKEGVDAPDSRRRNIAHELESIEKDIAGIDKSMKSYRDTVRILNEVKRAKTTAQDPTEKFINRMDPAKVKGLLIESKSKEKLNERKRENLLSSIDDVSSLDDDEKGEESKYMDIFREMDKSRENLSPTKGKQESSKSEEKDSSEENE
ncbi:MAG: hypothetical protein M1375_01145 [Candidatus Thermoplasmatota archaeon]|jgi:hypothetical protein|nr:hypothetical protein [Candidatus Thermoplasmatota archaeon]MCL5790565.1 hypothetical protein [Candidatus Thermoplasmatota archaeon]